MYNKDKNIKKSKKLITYLAFWKICIEKSIAFFKENTNISKRNENYIKKVVFNNNYKSNIQNSLTAAFFHFIRTVDSSKRYGILSKKMDVALIFLVGV